MLAMKNQKTLVHAFVSMDLHISGSIHSFLYAYLNVACRKGYYKSEQNSTCVPCPQNTKLDKEAADHCECEEGYFRAPNEGIGVSCTGKLLNAIIILLYIPQYYANL